MDGAGNTAFMPSFKVNELIQSQNSSGYNAGSRSKLLSSSDTRTVQMLDSEEAAHFAKKRRRSVARQLSNVEAVQEHDSQDETIAYTIDRDGNFQDVNFEQQQKSHVQNQQQVVQDNSQEE